MKQEDKQLLLTDLSARLPHKVKIEITWWVVDEGTCMNTTLEPDHIDQLLNDDDTEIKPYLRPLCSMTDEEKKEIEKITNNSFYVNSTYNYITNYKPRTYGDWDGNWHSSYNCYHYPVTNVECNKLISWLDKKHFDHRTDEEGKTLIEKGLANEAPKDMYK